MSVSYYSAAAASRSVVRLRTYYVHVYGHKLTHEITIIQKCMLARAHISQGDDDGDVLIADAAIKTGPIK